MKKKLLEFSAEQMPDEWACHMLQFKVGEAVKTRGGKTMLYIYGNPIFYQRCAQLHFKGAALPLTLQLPKWNDSPAPTPISKKSCAPSPAAHKKQRRFSCRSFFILDVYKKKANVIILLQAQQIESKKNNCWYFVTKEGGSIDTRHYKPGINDLKCKD